MRTAIWGAGQAGSMVKYMLPANQELICFIDSNTAKLDRTFCGMRVLSPEQIAGLNIEIIWIAVLNSKAVSEIKILLKDIGFKGEIIDIQYFIKNQDLRLASLRLAARQITERSVEGEIVELGVYKGDTAKELNILFPDRKLYLFDTFKGFADKDLDEECRVLNGERKQFSRDFKDTSVDFVLSRLPYPEKAAICKGRFPESLNSIALPEKIAFVSLDPDLYAPVKNGLDVFYPRMSKGGVIHIHDYNSMQFPGVKLAVDKFCAENNLFVLPVADFHGSAVLMKY